MPNRRNSSVLASDAPSGHSVITADEWWPLLWAVTAAFGTYFCMYAFRKPFAVATYSDVSLGAFGGNWDYKTVAVASQVMGYMFSKFVGIKVLSELPPRMRGIAILSLIITAELALVGFGFVPAPYNLVCLFVNGLPLGMVFGLVLGFLEGRRQTEALAAILCTSFILADGFVKSVGKALLEAEVPQFWMPAATGLIFLLPMFLFVGMLTRVEPPTRVDVALRSERPQIDSRGRRAFFMSYAPGLTAVLIMYLLVTVLRSVRSDFAPEIWTSLGIEARPELFSYSELWVGLGVTLANGVVIFVRDNYRAFQVALATCVAGFVILLLATFGQHSGKLSGFWFMVFIGVGLYLPYVATHTTLFERLISFTRDRSNLVFLMYLADSIGYLGYVGVMLVRNSFKTDSVGGFISFFRTGCYVVGAVSLLCMVGCSLYFARFRTSPPADASSDRDGSPARKQA